MGLPVEQEAELRKLIDERKRDRGDLDKLADDDAMRDVREEIYNVSTAGNNLKSLAFNAVLQVEPVLAALKQLPDDPAGTRRDLAQIRSIVDELKRNTHEGHGKNLADAVQRALRTIKDREADYALRTDRLKLERARADVAAVVVESFPIGSTGRLGAQIGAALLASGAASAALLQSSGKSITANYSVSGLSAATGIAILATSFLFMWFRETEKRNKYERVLGDVVIHEPPRISGPLPPEPPPPGFVEAFLARRRIKRARADPPASPPSRPPAEDQSDKAPTAGR